MCYVLLVIHLLSMNGFFSLLLIFLWAIVFKLQRRRQENSSGGAKL